MSPIKKLIRFTSLSSAFLGLLSLIRLPDGPLLSLTSFKMLGASLTPILAILGFFFVLAGRLMRDWRIFWAGIFGAAFSVLHVFRVTKPHSVFERIAGPAWKENIPLSRQAAWLPNRFPLLPLRIPKSRCLRDLALSSTPSTTLLADLWLPEPSIPSSGIVILYLHNSGWHYLDKGIQTDPFFSYLAAHGHILLDLAYPLAPQATIEEMLTAIQIAIDWIDKNPEKYWSGKAKIVLMGASAGAHLALLAACTSTHPEFQFVQNIDHIKLAGVVSYYGVSDLQTAHRTFQRIPKGTQKAQPLLKHFSTRKFVDAADFLPSLLKGTPQTHPDRYEKYSPLHYASKHSPPTMLLHGAHDFGILPIQSQRMQEALSICRVPAMYLELPCSDHAFDIFFPRCSPAFRTSLYDVERFLDWLNYIP